MSASTDPPITGPEIELDDCPVCFEPLPEDGSGHPECEAWAAARTCCKTVWVDYEPGEPCEICGQPIGEGA